LISFRGSSGSIMVAWATSCRPGRRHCARLLTISAACAVHGATRASFHADREAAR
jgi:hypothetical protein